MDGGLLTYSFLCPNGTIFNQQYFICDWWFNVDCSLAEEFYSLNEDIAAEQAANTPEGVEGDHHSKQYISDVDKETGQLKLLVTPGIGIGAGGDIDPLATSYLPSYPSSLNSILPL